MLLVTLAADNALLGNLCVGNGLLDGNVPAVTLGVVVCLEGVLVTVELEGKLVLSLLLEVGCLGLGVC